MTDAQHRQIRIRIVAHEIGMKSRIVIEAHRDLFRPVHDMTVGEQVAIGREEKTRAAGLLSAPPACAGAGRTRRLDEGHRGRHPLERADHRAGVGVEQRRIIDFGCTAPRCHGTVVCSPLRPQHAQLKIILGCAESPSTMSLFTRRTKLAGSSNSPPSASIAWS